MSIERSIKARCAQCGKIRRLTYTDNPEHPTQVACSTCTSINTGGAAGLSYVWTNGDIRSYPQPTPLEEAQSMARFMQRQVEHERAALAEAITRVVKRLRSYADDIERHLAWKMESGPLTTIKQGNEYRSSAVTAVSEVMSTFESLQGNVQLHNLLGDLEALRSAEELLVKAGTGLALMLQHSPIVATAALPEDAVAVA